MINDQQTKRMNKSAQRVVVDTLESYGMVWDRLVKAQEAQTRLAKNLSEGTIRTLRIQAEGNLDTGEELVEQARKRREAARVLRWESAGAYMDFLDSMFFYYGENARAAEKSTMKG